ncbi:MAG: hypothetical protein Q9170_007513 [Blastenia crenularia]
MATREATHAGSWYTDDGPTLSLQLQSWLDKVPPSIDGIGQIPQAGARIIIAPHAGYSYSGPAAAWAYKCLDLSKWHLSPALPIPILSNSDIVNASSSSAPPTTSTSPPAP